MSHVSCRLRDGLPEILQPALIEIVLRFDRFEKYPQREGTTLPSSETKFLLLPEHLVTTSDVSSRH